MAFVLAIIIWLIGSACALLSAFGAGVSDSVAVDARSAAWSILFASWVIATFVASTHWVGAHHW